jgi:hypothetical protein
MKSQTSKQKKTSVKTMKREKSSKEKKPVKTKQSSKVEKPAKRELSLKRELPLKREMPMKEEKKGAASENTFENQTHAVYETKIGKPLGKAFEDKQVLTLLNEAHVKDFVHYATRYVDLSPDRIRAIVDRFLKEGYVEILEDNDELHYFHTRKVTPDMLDEHLDHTLRFEPKEFKRPQAPRHLEHEEHHNAEDDEE